MYAKILGHKPVRRTTPRDDPHEGQIRHILHRRKDQGGPVLGDKVTHRAVFTALNSVDNQAGLLNLVDSGKTRILKWTTTYCIPKKF